jgi:hypothetical protein
VTKVEFTVTIQKKSNIVAVEEPTITKSKKGAAGLKYNKDHAHFFFFQCEGDCSP